MHFDKTQRNNVLKIGSSDQNGVIKRRKRFLHQPIEHCNCNSAKCQGALYNELFPSYDSYKYKKIFDKFSSQNKIFRPSSKIFKI